MEQTYTIKYFDLGSKARSKSELYKLLFGGEPIPSSVQGVKHWIYNGLHGKEKTGEQVVVVLWK